jgi:hypothetical protein
MRTFPIMHQRDYDRAGSTEKQLRAAGVLFAVVNVPWPMIEPHALQARHNHSQTLERLAERGGLSACEALAVIEDRPYSTIPEPAAHIRLLDLICEFQKSPITPEANADASVARAKAGETEKQNV